MSNRPLKFIKLSEVLDMTGLSKQAWQRRQKTDGAPQPIKLSIGINLIGRSTPARYLEADIFDYMQRKVSESKQLGNADATASSNDALNRLQSFLALINRNRPLLDAIAYRKSIDMDDFLWCEARSLVSDLAGSIKSVSNSFGLEVAP